MEQLSLLFVIVLLMLIFRSLTLALVTLHPAAHLGHHRRAAGRRGGATRAAGVIPIAQLLMIVLVLGAGTDYGLFLVFRVREELRARHHEVAGEYYPGSRGVGGSMARDLIHPRPASRESVIGPSPGSASRSPSPPPR